MTVINLHIFYFFRFLLLLKTKTRLKQKIITFGITCILIVLSGVLVYVTHTRSSILSVIAIVLCNTVTPKIVEELSTYESHENETTLAASSYIKVTTIRWINTAVIFTAITPFTATLERGKLIESLRILFNAELIQSPVIKLLDLMGNIKRHILAPRALDQRRSKYK